MRIDKAFESARRCRLICCLRASLPAIATVDPLVSIVLGVLAYDEHLRPGAAAISGEILCLAVLCAAAIYLSRLTVLEEIPALAADPASVGAH